MQQIEVIDNFLNINEFKKIQSIMLGPNIPWFMNNYITRPEYTGIDDRYNYQFTHTFYRNYGPCSDLFGDVIDPIFLKINPSAILRVKANLIPRSPKNIMHEMHTDIEHFKGKTAIFYINTNDGCTVFEDGTKIESLENRLIIFDSNLLHTGTSCTDVRARCLINLNYYNWDVI